MDIDLGTVDDVPEPRIDTVALDKADGDRSIAPSGDAVIVDEVSYANMPLEELTARGGLVDKATGEPSSSMASRSSPRRRSRLSPPLGHGEGGIRVRRVRACRDRHSGVRGGPARRRGHRRARRHPGRRPDGGRRGGARDRDGGDRRRRRGPHGVRRRNRAHRRPGLLQRAREREGLQGRGRPHGPGDGRAPGHRRRGDRGGDGFRRRGGKRVRRGLLRARRQLPRRQEHRRLREALRLEGTLVASHEDLEDEGRP